jgi:hypothetical protein
MGYHRPYPLSPPFARRRIRFIASGWLTEASDANAFINAGSSQRTRRADGQLTEAADQLAGSSNTSVGRSHHGVLEHAQPAAWNVAKGLAEAL